MLDEIAIPELREDDLADVPPLSRALTAGKSKVVRSVIAAGQYQNAIQVYLAATADADTQIGRVPEAFDESTHRDKPIVVLVSDHGFHMSEKNHGQKGAL